MRVAGKLKEIEDVLEGREMMTDRNGNKEV
jgi:hypothetical protein